VGQQPFDGLLTLIHGVSSIGGGPLLARPGSARHATLRPA
jgi:hypothetical protein